MTECQKTEKKWQKIVKNAKIRDVKILQDIPFFKLEKTLEEATWLLRLKKKQKKTKIFLKKLKQFLSKNDKIRDLKMSKPFHYH